MLQRSQRALSLHVMRSSSRFCSSVFSNIHRRSCVTALRAEEFGKYRRARSVRYMACMALIFFVNITNISVKKLPRSNYLSTTG